MLINYKSKENTRFVVPWDGCLLSGIVSLDGKISSLHDQDFLCNGERHINSLYLLGKELWFGCSMATLDKFITSTMHISMVSSWLILNAQIVKTRLCRNEIASNLWGIVWMSCTWWRMCTKKRHLKQRTIWKFILIILRFSYLIDLSSMRELCL